MNVFDPMRVTAATAANRPRTTGRKLLLFPEADSAAGVQMLDNRAGIKALRAGDVRGATAQQLSSASVVFDQLGVAVVQGDPDQLRAMSAPSKTAQPVLAIEDERIVYAAVVGATVVKSDAGGFPNGTSAEYLAGCRDMLDFLISRGNGHAAAAAVSAAAVNENLATWGLQVTGVVQSQYSGRGVKVAILDSGFDFTHPDFSGRAIQQQSFVNVPVQDIVVGHGTHVAGTACGPLSPSPLPRYGIAYNADLHVGRVLDDNGRGTDSEILDGISWAIEAGCRIISMSLGAPVQLGQPPSAVFENVARRARKKGALIIAAAGNESRRDLQPPVVSPIDHPANCPSIIAVAAVDDSMTLGYFSCGSVNTNGGKVSIAAPGVNTYSSWPMPTRYNRIMGTSMATPHVSGIAALYLEAQPNLTPSDLWTRIQQQARPLPLSPSDVGAGLVQAP